MKYEIIYYIKSTIPASGACIVPTSYPEWKEPGYEVGIVLNIQLFKLYRTHGNADVHRRSCDMR